MPNIFSLQLMSLDLGTKVENCAITDELLANLENEFV